MEDPVDMCPFDALPCLRYVSGAMPKHLARKCARCREFFAVIVNQPPKSNGQYLINGICAVCGYQLKGWRLIIGRKRPDNAYLGRMPKVFS